MWSKRRLRLAHWLLILLLAVTAGCQQNSSPPAKKETANSICVKLGENAAISLDSNATTGYRWEIVEFDKGILDLAGVEYKAPGSNLLGAAGKQVFTFHTVRRGKTKVSLKYVRSWEKDVAPAKTETVEVEVQ